MRATLLTSLILWPILLHGLNDAIELACLYHSKKLDSAETDFCSIRIKGIVDLARELDCSIHKNTRGREDAASTSFITIPKAQITSSLPQMFLYDLNQEPAQKNLQEMQVFDPETSAQFSASHLQSTSPLSSNASSLHRNQGNVHFPHQNSWGMKYRWVRDQMRS